MTVQFLRVLNLLVGDSAGQGLNLAADQGTHLSIDFETRQYTTQTWPSCTIRVRNLSDATANRITGEFTRVVLQAGYQDGGPATIFDGTIVQVRRGREDAASTYVEITALAGDQNWSGIVSLTVRAGSTFADRYQALVKAANGGTAPRQGFTDDLPPAALPRGRVFYGMARDHLRDLCASTDTQCWADSAGTNLCGYKSYLPNQIVTLNAQTGLIGFPTQTTEGIRVRSLLNGKFRVGGLVKLNDRDIQQASVNFASYGGDQAAFTMPAISADGRYKIAVCTHKGATRGQDWYSDLICIAVGDTIGVGAISGHGYNIAPLVAPAGA